MRAFAWISFLAMNIALGTGCAHHGPAPSVPVSEAEAIYVSGEGKAAGRPDRLRLHLGVEAKAETLDEAMKESTTRMTSLRAALIKLGVTETDMKTGQFSFSQVREPVTVMVPMPTTKEASSSEPAPRTKVMSTEAASDPKMHSEERWVERYVVTNTLEVCYSDLERAGELVTQAVAAGANNSWGLSFEIADPKPLEEKARQEALLDAKKRAKQIAAVAGIKVGRVLSVSDGSVGESGPVYGPMNKMAAMEAMPIESGQTEIRRSVSVVYAIER